MQYRTYSGYQHYGALNGDMYNYVVGAPKIPQMYYTNYHLNILEKAGCIFLPLGSIVGTKPVYWTSVLAQKITATGGNIISIGAGTSNSKLRIRLVRDVED